MTEEELDEFMADADLAQMLEYSRISDDIFDVIDLRENQHSDMLAWCLDPNEGHGQGDAVIKDFLLAAWAEGQPAKFGNKRFFEDWRPARVRTTSFGAAFLTRELGVELNVDGKKGRLDLFLVDPVNRIVITVENKAGRKLSPEQLSDYWKAVMEVARRRAFQGYHFAFVVVDRERTEDADLGDASNKWIVLDYTWLKTSAERARQHVERSNHAAQLLMAYCQRQTEDWQSESEQRLVELAGALAIQHRRVVDRLWTLRRDHVAAWTPSLVGSPDGDLLRFYYQNRAACKALLQGRGIAAVASTIKGLQGNAPAWLLNVYRQRLALCSVAAEKCMDLNAKVPQWPVYIAVRRITGEERGEALFQVRLVWVTSAFAPHVDPEELRKSFEENFPSLSTHRMRDRRRITLAAGLGANEAAQQAVAYSSRVDALIQTYLATGRHAQVPAGHKRSFP